MPENNRFSIELALRAGIVAKASLELLGCSNASLAKLYVVELARAVRELNEYIEKELPRV